MTVQKPNGGLLQNDMLQKSATTNTNTVRASCTSSLYTPKDKHPKYADVNDLDDLRYSEKSFPENAASSPLKETVVVPLNQRRAQKLQFKEQAKVKKLSNDITPEETQASRVVPRQTR